MQPTSHPILSDPEFSAKIRALNDSAKELNRTLVKARSKVRSFDSLTRSELLNQWTARYQEYGRLVNVSEVNAAALAEMINCYVSLGRHVNDQAKRNSLLKELEGLNRGLLRLDFDQTSEFLSLSATFETIKQSVAKNCYGATGGEIDRIQAEVVVFEQELKRIQDKTQKERDEAIKEINRNNRNLFTSFWSSGASQSSGSVDERTLGNAENLNKVILNQVLGGSSSSEEQLRAKIEAARVQLQQVRSRSTSGVIGDTDSRALLDTIDRVQKNIAAQAESLKTVFFSVTRALTNEIENYLSAAKKLEVTSSSENQLALRNAAQRVASSSVMWSERARVLTNEYAKAQK